MLVMDRGRFVGVAEGGEDQWRGGHKKRSDLRQAAGVSAKDPPLEQTSGNRQLTSAMPQAASFLLRDPR